MYYSSTRGGLDRLTSAQAILKGIAGNGGLYVPEQLPHFDADSISALTTLDYQQRAMAILKMFLTDYSEQELQQCITAAYGSGKFAHPAVAPVKQIQPDLHVLELWHGPTSAFKDMALQLLPQLLATALQKTGEQAEIVILTATSGDTGKAALEGFRDVDQTRIIVFYPHNGVSEIQRLQMVTQEGGNVSVSAVEGNFDDTQNGVKQIFNDLDFNQQLAQSGYQLSSANSINWGRLAPQIVYYFSAYADLVGRGVIQAGEVVNFVVPTGNFGNILAGYYAYRMGLPIRKLLCAANNNNVLADFLQTGTYNRKRPFHKTLSPSMDILISSNLERLLYHCTADTQQVAQWMQKLSADGNYTIEQDLLSELQELFWSDWADDTQTAQTIKTVFKQHGYTCDPHTAVAWHVLEKYRHETGDTTPAIIVSTASPFKFNTAVLEAFEVSATEADEFARLETLSQYIGWPVPEPLLALKQKRICHSSVCAKDDMAVFVKQTLA